MPGGQPLGDAGRVQGGSQQMPGATAPLSAAQPGGGLGLVAEEEPLQDQAAPCGSWEQGVAARRRQRGRVEVCGGHCRPPRGMDTRLFPSPVLASC